MERGDGRGWVHGVARVGAWLARKPVDFGLTALGAGVLVGRRLLDLVSAWRSVVTMTPPPRHDTSRVRERAEAAQRAARASGLLSRPRR